MGNVDIIINYAKGIISHEEFEAELNVDPTLWNVIQSLMPSDISNPNCRFRALYANVKGLETNNYQVKPTVLAFGYRPRMVYDLVSKLVMVQYPDIQCREPLDGPVSDLLMQLRLDYLEGEETEAYLLSILVETKDNSKNMQKQKILKAFHVENPRCRPRWVQEAEWPMGENSPMKYERQVKKGELVKFYFTDVDTGDTRVIEQLY